MNSSTDAVGPNRSTSPLSASLRNRLQEGTAFNTVGAIFNQGSTFLVNIAVANLLGRELFGEYTMIVATISTVASLGQLSMGYTATKHVAEYRGTDPTKASRILILCAVVAMVSAAIVAAALYIGADLLASRSLAAPHLAPTVRLSALAVLFAVLNGFLTGALGGLEAYRSLASVGMQAGAVYVTVCATLAWIFGMSGAVLGVAVTGLLQCGMLTTCLVREARKAGLVYARRHVWTERHVVGRFAIPASLTGLVTLPAIWASSALLARQADGFEQLALFGAANSYRLMVLFLPQAINGVSMSVLNNQLRTDATHYRRVFWINSLCTTGAAVGGATVLLVVAPMLLRLFGSEFSAGSTVLAILLGAAVLDAIGMGIYQLVVSNSRLWSSLVGIALPRDLTLVMAAAVLVPASGAVGLATAYAIAGMLGLLATIALAGRVGLGAKVEVGGVSAA